MRIKNPRKTIRRPQRPSSEATGGDYMKSDKELITEILADIEELGERRVLDDLSIEANEAIEVLKAELEEVF